MSERGYLVVAGACVRYLATSARRAGFGVIAADRFGDLDTAAAAARLVTVPDGDAEALSRSVFAVVRETGSRCGLVYGGGFEGKAALVALLARKFELYGNPPSTIDLVADPYRLFSLLKTLEIPTPEVRHQAPRAPEGWLVKHAASSGGMGIYRAASASKAAYTTDRYFQRQLPGPVVSALFAADGRDPVMLGFNRLSSRAVGERPFCYGGAVTYAGLDPGQRERIHDYARRLTRALGLRGINGLDLVLDRETPLLLELNPRPTATLELYDCSLPGGGIATHVAACRGRLPAPPSDPGRFVHGCRVLYAPCPLEIPTLRWPRWCRDRPVPGSRIPEGSPVCTIYARGRAVGEVERTLRLRTRGFLKLLTDLGRKAA